MKLLLITSILLVIGLTQLHGQQLTFKQRTQLTTGISTTDAPNLGVRYRISQSQIGLNAGYDFIAMKWNNQYVTIGPSFYQHLWGKSKQTDLKPWYLKMGLTGEYYSLYLDIDRTTYKGQIVYWKLHLGRDFNIGKRAGITFSMGPNAQLYRKWTFPETHSEGFEFKKFYSFDLSFFYSLQKP
jgi:hypothetical protein